MIGNVLDADSHNAKRTRLLTWYAVAAAVWGGALAALFAFVIDPGLGTTLTVLPTPSPTGALLITGLLLAGWLVWALSGLRLVLLARAARRDPALMAALTDERVRDNGREAFSRAFWVVVIGAALALPLEMVAGIVLTAKTYALVLIWLGPTAAISFFVASERRDAA